jgi:tight adherence protein C
MMLAALAPEVSGIAACAAVGLGIFILFYIVFSVLDTDDQEQNQEWRYDVNRINELRKSSLFYRFFQPIIQGFAVLNRKAFRSELPEIYREIQASGMPRVWTAEEYLGQIQLIALVISPVYFYLCLEIMGPPGVVIALVLTVLTVWLLRRNLAARAKYRLFKIKLRIPFFLDLMTLLMEAGSTFLDALRESVNEFRGHPVGEEFGRILAEMRMGKNRTSALEAMRDRLQDDEITSIIGTIIQAENQGTPLASIFRTQADVLRTKRSQRAETIAGEAGVKMLLPAVLIMAATVMIILGPFILGFMTEEFLQ